MAAWSGLGPLERQVRLPRGTNRDLCLEEQATTGTSSAGTAEARAGFSPCFLESSHGLCHILLQSQLPESGAELWRKAAPEIFRPAIVAEW
jgi:hypothetical protein